MKIKILVAVSAMVPGLLAPQAAADPGMDADRVQFFRSPSGNIQCEIDFQRGAGIPDGAYCMSWQPLQSVSIRPDGTLTNVCTGDTCGSDGPQDQWVLAYGRSTTLGPFTCLSEESGMTCTANGRGFEISSAGIAPV